MDEASAVKYPVENPAVVESGSSASRWNPRLLRWVLPAVLALCLLRMWIAPLPSSFWVDEMGTEFVVQHGANDPSLQVVPQVPASIYYVFPRIAQAWFGASEIAYRVPSVLFMGLALLLIARLAQRLIHPDAGWFVAFACLLLRDFNYQAADARPYALGTFAVSASLFCLVRWMDSGRWLHAALFGAFAALVWRVHLLFWPVYLIFGIYTLFRLLRGKSSAAWFQVGAIYALVGAALLPVLAQALALDRQAAAHVVASIPTNSDLTKMLKVDFVIPFCAAAALLSRWLRWPRVPPAGSSEGLLLIFAWWLCDPLSLFGFSKLTGTSVFLSRYMYIALPGVALAATVAVAAFLPTRYWKPLAAGLGLAVLITQGHWNRFLPAHHNSDWRRAARTVNAELTSGGTPIICPSPFIEARPPIWRPDYPTSSFLYSHLAGYPLHGTEYPFPFETSPEAEQYAATLSLNTLSKANRFFIYGSDTSVRFWRGWFSARPELANWHIHRVGLFGDVEVVVFESPIR